jgi:hypothetical protein
MQRLRKIYHTHTLYNAEAEVAIKEWTGAVGAKEVHDMDGDEDSQWSTGGPQLLSPMVMELALSNMLQVKYGIHRGLSTLHTLYAYCTCCRCSTT